ncbi:MAG: ABC transporter substrate-binding protein [Phycisphaeraceae bacterium]
MRRTSIIVALMLMLTACDADRHEGDVGDELRIVSLSPALTQMLVELDAGEHIVGVGEHDAAAPPGAAVVGGFPDIQAEALLSTRPTHVLAQSQSVHLRRLAESAGFELVAWRYPATIDAVLETLAPADPDPPGVGSVIGRGDEAAALRERIEAQLASLKELTDGAAERPRVLLLIGTRPVTASGPGTVFDDMLDIAGGRNAAPTGQAGAPALDREMLLAAAPEVIVLMSPGDRPLEALAEDDRLADLRGLDIPAVRNRRIRIINDPLAMLPTTTIPRVTAELIAGLHPELAEAARAVVRGADAVDVAEIPRAMADVAGVRRERGR